MSNKIENETIQQIVHGKEKHLLSALLNGTGSYCEFNVTQDQMIGTPLIVIDGIMNYQENVYQNLQIGKLSEYIKFFVDNYALEEKNNLLSAFDPKALIDGYTKGKKFFSVSYKAKMGIGEGKWFDRKVMLYQDENTNDLLGFSYAVERSRLAEVEQQNAELKGKVDLDYLTGCFSRRYIEEYIESYLSSEKVTGYFVLLDVDGFKKINDSVGHALGDVLLKEIVEDIQSVFYDDNVVARLGGDEFIVFIPDNYSNDEVKEKLRLLLKKCRKSVTVDEKKGFQVSLSAGVSCFPQDASTYGALYRKADKALYYSKECGRNRFTFYNSLNENEDVGSIEQMSVSFHDEPDSNLKIMLDSLQTTGIYVITEKEHKILFYNRKVKEITPHIELGMVCHELWAGSCEHCPIDIIQENSVARTINYKDPFGEVVEITATRTIWDNKIPAFLIRVYPHIDDANALKKTELIVKGTAVCTYVIDKNYRIISASHEMENVFSSVHIGQKCYKCFFDRNKPCENCARNAPQLQSFPHNEENQFFFSKACPYMLENGEDGYLIELYDVPDYRIESDDIIPVLKNNEEKDMLTGGYNREGYVNALGNLRDAGVDLTQYAIMFVNIKGFKAVNKIFGYQAGNNLLRSLYMRIYTSDLRPRLSARKESDHFIFLIKKERLNLTYLEEILKYKWSYQGQNHFIH